MGKYSTLNRSVGETFRGYAGARRINALQGQSLEKRPVPKPKKHSNLLWELSDDEDDSTANIAAIAKDPHKPWLWDFRAYLDTVEHIPKGWSTIT